jgi:hypothetical protein
MWGLTAPHITKDLLRPNILLINNKIMAQKYDRRTKEGKARAQAEEGMGMLTGIFKTLLLPFKLLFMLIVFIVNKVANK